MQASLNCVPCILRSVLLATKLSGVDEEMQETIMKKVLQQISEMDLKQTPPEITQNIQGLIRETTGVKDPYAHAKQMLNRKALQLYPRLKAMVSDDTNPLLLAVRLAITGNAMDMGANGNLDSSDIHKALEKTLEDPFQGDFNDFAQALSEAKTILYLADNSGEIVFDRVLIEQILPKRITMAVRGGPTLNDATLLDAQMVGLDKIVEVIDNGYDAPGTILSKCSPDFIKRFWESDLIIAKGQGNYETLNNVHANIFFLFKTKCDVIKDLINQPLGTQVLYRSKWES